MKAFIVSAALALLTANVYGAPSAPKPEKRVFEAAIEFNGAGGASFEQGFPTDGSVVPITNPLSISSITGFGGEFCTFFGIDGSEVVVIGEETVTVAPPQQQVSGSCQSD